MSTIDIQVLSEAALGSIYSFKNHYIMSGKATDILHAIPSDPLTGSISVPVYQTSTFVQKAPGVHQGYDYARSNNPTRKVLEDLVAKIEHGAGASAFATGLAAIDAVLKTLSAGDEVIAVDDIYGGAYRLFTHIYRKLGIKVSYVNTQDAENIIEHFTPRTRLVWLETPTNPTLKISDISAIAELAHKHNAQLVVDNTFAGPINQNPILLGADIIVHSATKYIGGHSDLVGGLVICKTKECAEQIKFIQNASGGILGPWDCFLTIRGIETLPLRFRQHSSNGLAVARALQRIPEVHKVYYPGLPEHQNHNIARAQQQGQYGGVVSFSLKEDTQEAAHRLIANLRYFKLAESLGGVKSLVCHPAQMTHASIPREKRLASGIQDSLVRLSCGIETTEDLTRDLEAAFRQTRVHHSNGVLQAN